ncbi:MAG: hypothetical protein R2795_13680 [Saprospiraceae bacterium]
MKYLSQLVAVVEQVALANYKLPGQTGCSYTDRIYEALVNEAISDEKEIAKLIFGKKTNQEGWMPYLQHLEDHLANTLLLVDRNAPVYDDPSAAYEEAIRYWMVSNVLVYGGNTNLAFDYAKRAHQLAVDFELTTLAVLTSKYLRKLASFFKGDTDAYNSMEKSTKNGEKRPSKR